MRKHERVRERFEAAPEEHRDKGDVEAQPQQRRSLRHSAQTIGLKRHQRRSKAALNSWSNGWKTAPAGSRPAITVEARDFYLQVKKAVVAFFGAQSAQLADFGLTPAKAKAPKTSAQKLVTAAKATSQFRLLMLDTSSSANAKISPWRSNGHWAVRTKRYSTPRLRAEESATR